MAARVFVIHGHDGSALTELRTLLTSLGVVPVVLTDEDNLGSMTIIEKFEHYARQCDGAVALLTPDDKQASKLRANSKWRARQNVILEIGWFMRKVGRKRVALLHKGDVELPSDLLGVLYLPFSGSVYDVSDRLRQHLRGAKLIP